MEVLAEERYPGCATEMCGWVGWGVSSSHASPADFLGQWAELPACWFPGCRTARWGLCDLFSCRDRGVTLGWEGQPKVSKVGSPAGSRTSRQLAPCTVKKICSADSEAAQRGHLSCHYRSSGMLFALGMGGRMLFHQLRVARYLNPPLLCSSRSPSLGLINISRG